MAGIIVMGMFFMMFASMVWLVAVSKTDERRIEEVKKYILSIDREISLEECVFLEKKLKQEFPKINFSDFVYEKHEIHRVKKTKEEKETYLIFQFHLKHKNKIFATVNEGKNMSLKLQAK